MKPLVNLKAFLAMLLIFIVTGSVLVAYFRDYSTTAQGHDHSKMENGGGVALSDHGDPSVVQHDGNSRAAMGHDATAKPQGGPMQLRADAVPRPVGLASPQKPRGITLPFSALPGNPGASHLYHVGATGFFLDQPQHITLSAKQHKALNRIQEQTVLSQESARRKVEEAEQQLWKLTAAAQPDATQIEAKVREIEKLRGYERLGFIQAVGEAAKVLSEAQRTALVGTELSGTSTVTTPAPAHQHNP